MIWGGTASVPALGLWGALFLGALLGIAALRVLPKVRPRVLGLWALALAALLPLSVRAVPFTFTNGTVASADQVNANFAAVTPLTGFSTTQVAGPFASGVTDLYSPSFVAPRALTCLVHLDTHDDLNSIAPNGNGSVEAIKKENGVASVAIGQPLNDVQGAGFVRTVDGNTTWSASQTRLFTVASGSTVQFGHRVVLFIDFATAHDMTFTTVYECF
jgi:hypothetical protein